MTEEKEKIIRALRLPVIFAALFFAVMLFEFFTGISLSQYGIIPRQTEGVPGIFVAPFLHANFNHLISNVIPFLILGFGLFYFYPQSSIIVFAASFLSTNILVWLFAREAVHIGVSGVVYSLASFHFFSGIFKRDTRSITLAILVVFIYGGMVWGILPVDKGISWESHLFGGITGLVCALLFRKKDVYKKYEWEDEESEVPPEKLEIRYDKDWN